MSGRPWRADLVHSAHVVHGAVLLLRPAAVAGRVGSTGRDRTVAVVRVLGARHLAQGTVGLVAARRTATRLGAGVDALHAASMVGLAVVDRGHRRAATVSAVVAVGFALAGSWSARGG
jgi:hypothetical protein